MLNVTRLLYPSSPDSGLNYAQLFSPTFTPQGDLRMDVRMGWGETEGIARFGVSLMVNSGHVAGITYEEYPQRRLSAFAYNAPAVNIAPPPPGMYDFSIARVGNQFEYYFDGNLFAVLPDNSGVNLNGMRFFFSSRYPGPSGPFHIDRVRVVPAPGVVCTALAIGWIGGRRRRRSC